MRRPWIYFRMIVILSLILSMSISGNAQQEKDSSNLNFLLSGQVMELDKLEKMALENNPTIKQAEAIIRSVEGRSLQAGLLPNPIIGYMGEDFVFGDLSNSSKHLFFVEQKIPLGGKLKKSRSIYTQEAVQAAAKAEAQKQRVLNSIRIMYYEVLGAQSLVLLKGELFRLASEAVGISEELYNVGQADRSDLSEIEIEAQETEASYLQAQNNWEHAWQELASMVGRPELKPARLVGNLEDGIDTLDQESVLATLLHESPEIKAALAGVERARAALSRARAERMPDLFLRGGIGYNREWLDDKPGKRVGTEGFIEAGITVPIFNHNQGGIASAEAELIVAEREVERLRLSLRIRFARAFRNYRNSLLVVEKYRSHIVPYALNSYELYQTGFKQMAASYPQVLIARRSLFQKQVEYAKALTELRSNLINIRGFLLTGGLDEIGLPGDERISERGQLNKSLNGESDE
jgi:outer membrane protein, heavy metal efflux system